MPKIPGGDFFRSHLTLERLRPLLYGLGMDSQNPSSTHGPGPNGPVVHYEQVLLDRYGPLIGGADLLQVAGFPNSEALRLAVRRDVVGFKVFAVPGRRGRFALATDVARWLAKIDFHQLSKEA